MIGNENPAAPPDPAPQQGSPDAPNRNRRRLLVGAASVFPTAYTLSSGAAAAAASHLSCLQAHENATPPRFVRSDDRWLRTQVQDGSFEHRGTHCINLPQADCADGMNPGQAGYGSQWVVDGVDGNRLIAGPGTPIQVNSGSHSYGLVYTNDDGTVTAMDPGYAGELYPTTKTCWASVQASQDFRLG
jgi:hypothetical protein